MRSWLYTFAALILFPGLGIGGEKEETYLKETMIPFACNFLHRIGQTNEFPTTTNQVSRFRVDYFDERPGCMAYLRLTNGCSFSFHTESNKTEVWTFHRPVKTYLELDHPPKEKIQALKKLNVQNRLNKKSALLPATKYFNLVGHKEENFHSPSVTQGYWVSSPESPPINERRLPYYEITWYRKDMDMTTLAASGDANFKTVMIEVSGIDSSLVSYSKVGMPIGSDF